MKYSRLNSFKSIILGAIQEFYIFEEDYTFINEQVDAYNELNEKIRQKRLKVN